VAGTGGIGLYPLITTEPNSEVRNNTANGVLKLTLHATSYEWQFVPIAGQTFTDSGSANCVTSGGPVPTATQPAGPTPTRTPTAIATMTMHVGDLDGSSTRQSNRWKAIVTITLHDASHNPLAKATVTGTWSNGATGTASCTTGSNGQCCLQR